MAGRVVIIEDNPEHAEVMARCLEWSGYTVEVYHRAVDGLRVIGERPPDTVLLDLMLPDLHGLEVLRQLRASPRTRRLPVLVVSCHTRPSTRRELLLAGADAFVGKPFALEELEDAVERLISGAPTGGRRSAPLVDSFPQASARIEEVTVSTTVRRLWREVRGQLDAPRALALAGLAGVVLLVARALGG